MLVLLEQGARLPIILAHVPILCQLLQIPLFVPPGKALSNIWKLLHVNSASILIFLDEGGVPFGNACKVHEIFAR